MIAERIGQRALRLFDRAGQRLFPNAPALGANRFFSGTLPAAGPILRPVDIKRVDVPNLAMMASLPPEQDGNAPTGGSPTPPTDPKSAKALAIGKAIVGGLSLLSRIPSLAGSASVRAMKAVFVGSVGGKVSVVRTIAKGFGLASLLSVVPFVAVSGPVGALSLVVTGPAAGLLYLAGRSKKNAPPPESKKKLPFWRVENRIPARTRSLTYVAYGLNLFTTGLVLSAGSLFMKVAMPAAGLLVLGAHLLSRHSAKRSIAKRDHTPEPQTRRPRQQPV